MPYKKSLTTIALEIISRPRNAEMGIQKQIVDYLRLNKITVHSCPNGAHFNNPITRILMKMIGLTPGVADLQILLPEGIGIFVEVKTPTGKQSKDQKLWQAHVKSLGFSCLIWRSLYDAVNFLNSQK